MFDFLTKKELIELLFAYDRYIQECNDENRYFNGYYPVCIEEFFYNDFEFYKNND